MAETASKQFMAGGKVPQMPLSLQMALAQACHLNTTAASNPPPSKLVYGWPFSQRVTHLDTDEVIKKQ